MERAWALFRRAPRTGAATLLVASLEHEFDLLAVANLGDCGAVVVRDQAAPAAAAPAGRAGAAQAGQTLSALAAAPAPAAPATPSNYEVVFRSGQTMHGFNRPFSLGWTPVEADAARFDAPTAADVSRFPLRPGDVVVFASDGLFDNMEEEEVVGIVGAWAREGVAPARAAVAAASVAAGAAGASAAAAPFLRGLASRLALRAKELSQMRDRDSPFAKLAKDHDQPWKHGGRPDDVMVVAALVL
jgi:protein phosphatase PTC7